jgi:hypothetical protein
MSKEAHANTCGGYYINALRAASFEGDREAVELFLSKGAEFNA